MEERSFHPLDYVSVLQRRKWWLIVPIVACVLIGGALALLLPREYKSEAEIGIVAPTLSGELLRGVSSLNPAERQRAISQQLLSREVLERVVREEQLSPSQPVEQTAARLRPIVEKNIVVPLPIGRQANPNQQSGIDSFRLGYVDKSPERAQRIANRLAMVFVEENSKTTTEVYVNTAEVLAQQVRSSQERLQTLTSQLRTKKEAYMGRLPDQMNANIQAVNGMRQQLESISMELRGEQDRLRMVEGQLDAMRQGISTSGLTHTSAAAIQSSQARLYHLQQELVQARAAGYTDAHPEIVRINHEMAEARKEMNTSREQNPNNREAILMADPAYRQKAAERDASRLRIAGLEREARAARTQIATYQSRVDAAPMVEQELASLQQAHDIEKTNYTDLTKKHQDAIVAEDLARKQGGERFSILYPAYFPTKPDSPDLIRLMVMALGLGLALGAAAVVGRELIDRSVHDVEGLQTEFDVPVLGEIPRIHGTV
jgi:polysaccharide chain length determinant protein (PEP-CTERM system associated)